MTFDTLKLDKGLYTSEKGFTKTLEGIDPSENYKGTELEGLDAYERQLKRFDIKVKGKESDPISKFFMTSDSAVLFPEYVRRSVSAVIDQENAVDKIVATTTYIDSLDYRSVQCDPIDPNDRFEVALNEGTYIPEVNIETRNNLTKLKKFGRRLVASYEAIKSQRLDLFTVMLGQIGNYINACELAQAIAELREFAVVEVDGAVKGQPSYSDFLLMHTKLSPYQLNTIICESDVYLKLLCIQEMKDGMANLTFHGTGKPVTPLGANIIHSKGNYLGGAMIALDKNFALEKVQFGDLVVDYDKLIDRQLESATITATSGFNRIVDTASVIINKRL